MSSPKSKGNKRETRTYANPYFTFRYFEVCEWSTMYIMFVNHSRLKKVGWYFPTLLKLKSRRIMCLSKYNLKVEMREWLTAPLHKQLLAAGVTAAKRGGDPTCGDPTRGGRPGARHDCKQTKSCWRVHLCFIMQLLYQNRSQDEIHLASHVFDRSIVNKKN